MRFIRSENIDNIVVERVPIELERIGLEKEFIYHSVPFLMVYIFQRGSVFEKNFVRATFAAKNGSLHGPDFFFCPYEEAFTARVEKGFVSNSF